MSGIAGIIHFDGKPVEPGLVEKMTGAMAYRGPDGIHHWIKGPVALGQCMLRTTPESLEEHQPLTNEDESLVLVMDGRVDNWEELRRELLARGAVLRNRSDAELVLRSYEVWGRDCLPHIDGDFALVIWDARRQEAFCARDRMGNKPFNYHWNGKTFVFASELHTILALPWVPEIPNEGMLAEFLAAEWYSRDETLWIGILRLVAAHRMMVGSGGPRPEQYWEPDLWATLPYTKDEEYIEHYRELLFDSVRRLSRSHRPVAYEVSGGLDSSAVFCVAEHLRSTNKLPAPALSGYTLAFTDDSEANELDYARLVGEYFQVKIKEISPSLMPVSWYRERADTRRDFPGFPNGIMLQDLRCYAALDGSRAIVNGIGGDEWLEGSRLYYAEELAQRNWFKLYGCLITDTQEFGAKRAIAWLLRYGFFPLLPPGFQESVRLLVRRIRGNRDTYWLSFRMRETIKRNREAAQAMSDQPVQYAGQRVRLATLYRTAYMDIGREHDDCLNASFGLEARRPLYTSRLVQYAFSIPERLRLRGDRTKYIHTQALKGLLPHAILDRKSKAEFSVVFRRHLDPMRKAFIETLPRERADWITPRGMTRLYGAYQENPRAGWPLWILWSIHGCDMLHAVAVNRDLGCHLCNFDLTSLGGKHYERQTHCV